MAFIRTDDRAFVYGRFFVAPKKSTVPPPPSADPRYAIEILREFSSTEFVGKLYVNVGTWRPATWNAISQHKWYQVYEKFRYAPPATKSLLHFEMDGSGIWDAQYLRDESDTLGPYIAVALKYSA